LNTSAFASVAVLAGSLALGLTLFAQQDKTPATPAVDPNKVVMVVGDSQMTAGQFDGFVEALPKEVQQMARGPAKRKVAEDLLKLKLLAAEARKKGLDKTDRFKQQMDLMRDNALAGALIADLQTSLVTDKDIQAYYDSHKAEFQRATTRHILISTSGEKALTDEQAKAKADALKKRLDGGEDFAAVAKAESQDPGSKDDGGALQPFGPGQMVPEFEQMAFSQEINAISAPVKTRYGYHIIQTQKRDVAPLAEVKDEIADLLRPQKLETLVDQLRKQVNPTLDDAFFGPPAPPAAPEKPAR